MAIIELRVHVQTAGAMTMGALVMHLRALGARVEWAEDRSLIVVCDSTLWNNGLRATLEQLGASWTAETIWAESPRPDRRTLELPHAM